MELCIHPFEAPGPSLPSTGPPVLGRAMFLPGDRVEVKDELRRQPVPDGADSDWLPGTVVSTHPLTVRPDEWDHTFEWDDVRSYNDPAAPKCSEGPHSELLELRARSSAAATRGGLSLRRAQLANQERSERAAIERELAPAWAALKRELDALYVAVSDWFEDPYTAPVKAGEVRQQIVYWEQITSAMGPPPPPPPSDDLLAVLRAELQAEQAVQDAEEERLREKQQQESMAVNRRRSSMRLLAEKGSMRRR